MRQLHATRRWILGALVVGMALTAVGTGGASAVEDDGAFYVGGHGSKARFKSDCTGSGGTFIDDDGNGNTECHFKNGSWEECDANGGDCWFTPPAKLQTPDDTIVEPDSAVADDPGGWQSPTSVAQASVVAPDDERAQDQDTTKKDKKGKKGKKGGKGRK